jgi:hypothetical protein
LVGGRGVEDVQVDGPIAVNCPKDHQQHLELAANYPKIGVGYTQIVTISTDTQVSYPPRLSSCSRAFPGSSLPGSGTG